METRICPGTEAEAGGKRDEVVLRQKHQEINRQCVLGRKKFTCESLFLNSDGYVL